MKRALPAVAAALTMSWLAPARAAPQCPGEVALYPAPGARVPTNARFILEGRGEEQERVQALVGKELWLKSDDDAVTAKVLRGWTSRLQRTAVILRPRTLLKPNRSYRLALDQALPRFRLVGGSTDLPLWRTGSKPDERAPQWAERPSPAEASLLPGSDGPLRQVKLRLRLEDVSPLYLVVSLRKLGFSSDPQSYFVPVRAEGAVLGNDGCTGSFLLDDRASYRGSIQAYDVVGNRAGTAETVEFKAPVAEGQ